MKEIGKKINSMVREWRHGQMELNMMEHTFMERSMERVALHGLMEAHTTAISKIIIFRVMAATTGLMAECSLVHG